MFINELSSRSLPGDYYWKQYSMWEVAPKGSIKKEVWNSTLLNGMSKAAHYYLVKVISVDITINGTKWQTEVVKQGEVVPEEVMNWRV